MPSPFKSADHHRHRVAPRVERKNDAAKSGAAAAERHPQLQRLPSKNKMRLNRDVNLGRHRNPRVFGTVRIRTDRAKERVRDSAPSLGGPDHRILQSARFVQSAIRSRATPPMSHGWHCVPIPFHRNKIRIPTGSAGQGARALWEREPNGPLLHCGLATRGYPFNVSTNGIASHSVP